MQIFNKPSNLKVEESTPAKKQSARSEDKHERKKGAAKGQPPEPPIVPVVADPVRKCENNSSSVSASSFSDAIYELFSRESVWLLIATDKAMREVS